MLDLLIAYAVLSLPALIGIGWWTYDLKRRVEWLEVLPSPPKKRRRK